MSPRVRARQPRRLYAEAQWIAAVDARGGFRTRLHTLVRIKLVRLLELRTNFIIHSLRNGALHRGSRNRIEGPASDEHNRPGRAWMGCSVRERKHGAPRRA
jgi:hypothetical protein